MIRKTQFITLICGLIFVAKSSFSYPVSDNFNGSSLNPSWIIEKPDSNSSVTLNGDGRLLIQTNTNNNDLWTPHNVNAPRLYQPVNNTDSWIVTTKMSFNPSATFQEAGVMAKVTGAPAEWGGYMKIASNMFFWDSTEYIKVMDNLIYGNYDTVYLKIQKIDNLYTGWYSFDGNSYTMADTASIPYTVVGIGLFAIRQDSIGPDPEGTADNSVRSTAYFDYFEINNPIPEPVSFILMGISLLSFIIRKKCF